LSDQYDGTKPFSNLFYGAGVGITTASNTNIKGSDRRPSVAKRFMAPRNGSIEGVIWHARRNVGQREKAKTYSGGTGGKIKIQIRPDNGKGHWSTTVLAETEINNGSPKPLCDGQGIGPGPSDQFVRWTFTKQAAVVQGQWYHLVYCNMDENPNANYISENSARIPTDNVPANEPWGGPAFNGFNVVRGDGPRLGFTMAADIIYTDDFSWGTGYWTSEGTGRKPIGGESKVRELFTVSGWDGGAAYDRTVKIFYVFLMKAKANAGDLTVKLMNGDGTLIEQQTLRASQFPTNKFVWREGSFAKPYTLAAGKQYIVEWSSNVDEGYRVAPIMEDPHDLGFGNLNTWNGGLFEWSDDVGATWQKPIFWDRLRSDTDLPFLFKLEP
jgi:hypothetical protein